jgi:hypothetical protein
MISAEGLPQDSLCFRLRRERERRQIPLSSISANTKISVSLFQALERGDVSRWPGGIFRRSFIRAYAEAIGLDPDCVAREFSEEFPDPAEPSPSTTAATTVHAQSTVHSPLSPAEKAGLRLKLADSRTPFMHGRVLTGLRPRLAAVACDAGVIAAVAVCMFIAFEQFWLPLGLAMIGYYLGGILLLGNTPGVCLLAPDGDAEPHYNQSPDDADHAGSDERTHSPWHLSLPAR